MEVTKIKIMQNLIQISGGSFIILEQKKNILSGWLCIQVCSILCAPSKSKSWYTVVCIFHPTVFCPCCRYGFTFWLTLAVASSFSDVWIGKLLEERKGCKIFNSLRRLVLMCRSPCLALRFVLLPHCALCAASQWAEDEYQTFIENFVAKKYKRMQNFQ